MIDNRIDKIRDELQDYGQRTARNRPIERADEIRAELGQYLRNVDLAVVPDWDQSHLYIIGYVATVTDGPYAAGAKIPSYPVDDTYVRMVVRRLIEHLASARYLK